MALDSIIIWLIVGGVAGILAEMIMKGGDLVKCDLAASEVRLDA